MTKPMKKNDFEFILRRAVQGNNAALEKIFEIYEPMIYKYSCVNGRFDPDMNQQLLLHIALNIHKFTI